LNTAHQHLVAVNQSRVLGVNELDGLNELVACLEVELLEWLAQDGGKDGDELGG
jgi:hypothetical protein